jgi:hypothetical protein
VESFTSPGRSPHPSITVRVSSTLDSSTLDSSAVGGPDARVGDASGIPTEQALARIEVDR